MTYSARRRRRPPPPPPLRRRRRAPGHVPGVRRGSDSAPSRRTPSVPATGSTGRSQGSSGSSIPFPSDRRGRPSRSPRRPTRPTASPGASPTATPAAAVRTPVDVTIIDDPEAVFAHEARKDWCAPAGVQMTLAALGLGDTSDAFQRELPSRVREWESIGGQPQLRVGTRGDGPCPRGVRRAGLRDPGLQVAQRRRPGCGHRDRRRRSRRRSCSPGRAPTPGS